MLRNIRIVALALVLLSAATMPAVAQAPIAERYTADQAREENAYAIGLQAYLWGFPLQYYGQTVPDTIKAGGAYVNELRKFTELKTAADRFVVTPNNVTIDAYGAGDVTAEPLVIVVPPLPEPRWYIVQIGNFFDEVTHNIGGTKGPQPGVYVVTGPDFKGAVPGDMTEIRSRTRGVTVAVRIFARNQDDVARAVAAQNGFYMLPLSGYLKSGLAYTYGDDRAIIPVYASSAPDDIRFFDNLGHWMKAWLPVSADTDDSLIASFHQIGLSVGRGFEWHSLDDPSRRGLARAVINGKAIVDRRWDEAGEMTNGWKYTFAGGRAGQDFALRAALAAYVQGAELSDQVIYPNTSVDDKGEKLNGARKYVLHFDAGQEPPVSVFWNLSLYGPDMLFVENDLKRYSIGSTTDGLKKADDGSTTILIQKDKPEDTANWLPAPDGDFNLTMRFYGPQTSVLNGSYRLPAVRRVDTN